MGRWVGFGCCRCGLLDDHLGDVQLGESAPGLGQGRGELVDLCLEFTGPGGDRLVLGAEYGEGFGDVQAASLSSLRQAGLGVVRRRAMFEVAAQ